MPHRFVVSAAPGPLADMVLMLVDMGGRLESAGGGFVVVILPDVMPYDWEATGDFDQPRPVPATTTHTEAWGRHYLNCPTCYAGTDRTLDQFCDEGQRLRALAVAEDLDLDERFVWGELT